MAARPGFGAGEIDGVTPCGAHYVDLEMAVPSAHERNASSIGRPRGFVVPLPTTREIPMAATVSGDDVNVGVTTGAREHDLAFGCRHAHPYTRSSCHPATSRNNIPGRVCGHRCHLSS